MPNGIPFFYVRGSDCSEHEAQAAAYGRGWQAATGGSRFDALTGVAAAKQSKAESTTATSGAGPP